MTTQASSKMALPYTLLMGAWEDTYPAETATAEEEERAMDLMEVMGVQMGQMERTVEFLLEALVVESTSPTSPLTFGLS